MIQKEETATLKAIFSEVLANLAFMFTDEEQPEVSTGDIWMETTIIYQGSTNGTLRFHCTREFAVLLASNLLGVSPEDEIAYNDATDAVKEFMNILCGQLVTSFHGTDEVFNLTIPEVQELPEPPDATATDDSELATACVDGHQVRLFYSQH